MTSPDMFTEHDHAPIGIDKEGNGPVIPISDADKVLCMKCNTLWPCAIKRLYDLKDTLYGIIDELEKDRDSYGER